MNYLRNKISTLNLVSISIGIVYFAFGILKFFPHLSPAEDLAEETISKLTFGLVRDEFALISLAIMETLIGVALIIQFKHKVFIQLALFHMAATFLPFIFFPEITFDTSVSSFSIVGQYIVKNIIIISALLNLKSEYAIQQKLS
ncbi:MAG: doxx family protein [Bacteroidetes bacterium HGW-Bacteroidetes-18]|nr:MAG: doxx family protein [Bacteroidetes bacterium HGW-Bacteroidetes-18]